MLSHWRRSGGSVCSTRWQQARGDTSGDLELVVLCDAMIDTKAIGDGLLYALQISDIQLSEVQDTRSSRL